MTSTKKKTDEELRRQLLQTIFKFKRLANVGIGARPDDGKYGINISELMLMHAVQNNSPGNAANVTPTEIGQFLSVSKGAVSQMMASLEAKGYIVRAIDSSNRRSLLVTLTPQGEAVLADEGNTFNADLDALIGRVGRKDIEQLIRLVGKLTEALA